VTLEDKEFPLLIPEKRRGAMTAAERPILRTIEFFLFVNLNCAILYAQLTVHRSVPAGGSTAFICGRRSHAHAS
jgi:hypothetical protein